MQFSSPVRARSVQHEGFLSLRTSATSRSATRYCVLVNSRLTLYETRADAEALRNMRGELVVLGASSWDGRGRLRTHEHGFLFSTTTSGAEHARYCVCESAAHKRLWVDGIQAAVALDLCRETFDERGAAGRLDGAAALNGTASAANTVSGAVGAVGVGGGGLLGEEGRSGDSRGGSRGGSRAGSEDEDGSEGMATPSVHGYSATLQFKPPVPRHARSGNGSGSGGGGGGGADILSCRSCACLLSESVAGGVSATGGARGGVGAASAPHELTRHGGPMGSLLDGGRGPSSSSSSSSTSSSSQAQQQQHSTPLPQYGLSQPARVCAQCYLAQSLLSYLKVRLRQLARD